jgi:hypothetical protein
MAREYSVHASGLRNAADLARHVVVDAICEGDEVDVSEKVLQVAARDRGVLVSGREIGERSA